MKKKLMELIVGLVFVGGTLLLGFYTIAISGLHFGATKQYVVDFEKVYGLKEGDPVRVEGHEKGKVSSLRLLPEGKVRAVLEVSDEVEIYRQDSDVRVTPFSPLGGRVVEIKRGKKGRGAYTYFGNPNGVPQDQADVIEGKAEGELLQTLNSLIEDNSDKVSTILSNIEHVSGQLKKTDNIVGYLLNDEEGSRRISSVAGNLQSASARIDRILGRVEEGQGVVGGLLQEGSPLEENVNGAVSAGRDSLQSLSVILARADRGESGLGVLVADDKEVASSTRGIVTDVKVVTGEVAGGRGTLGKLVKDDRLYEGAANTATNLESITAKIDSGEGLLGVLLEREAGDDTRETLHHLASITRAIDDPEAGTLGLLVHDGTLRGRISRIGEEVERLVVEFRDALEDTREQAPVNAFIGAVFSAF